MNQAAHGFTSRMTNAEIAAVLTRMSRTAIRSDQRVLEEAVKRLMSGRQPVTKLDVVFAAFAFGVACMLTIAFAFFAGTAT